MKTRGIFLGYVLGTLCLIALFINTAAQGADFTDHLRGITIGPGILDLGGSIRFRYESMDNYSIKGYGTGKTDDVLLSRLRAHLRYTFPEGPIFSIQGQDARFWLSDLKKDDFGPSCPWLNEFDLRQAYMEWKRIGHSPLGFKIGRQAISYGDNRIFGPGNWGNVGRYTWDVGKLLLNTSLFDLDIFGGQRVFYLKDKFDDEHFPYHVYTAYAQIKSIPGGNKLDLFYVVKRNPDETTKGEAGIGDLLVQTAGFYGKGKWQDLDYAGTFAYQFGDYGKDNIRALGLNAEVGYTPFQRFQPRVAVSLSYASGDKDPNDGTHGTFDGVFGAIDKYYGRMNFFSWMNLVDWEIGISVKPLKGMKVELDYHRFRLAQAKDAWYFCNGKKMRWDPSGASGRDLGQEIDLIWKYRVHRHITLMAGCAWFFPGDFIKATGTHDDARWAFGQIELTF